MLALVTDAFGGRGGIAQYNRDFLSALAAAGHRVVALPRHAPDRAEPPAGITQRRATAGRVAYSLAALVEALRTKPRIVFCGHIYAAPLGWLAAKLAGAELIAQVHGIEAWPRPSRLVRWACERAAMILSVSRYTRAKVLDWAAIPPERIVVLPNTVAECFMPGDGTALRHAWGLDGKKVLLTVGRMSASERYKGQDKVIAALPDLIAAGHDVIHVVVGEGDDQRRLERLAAETGVSSRVRFVGALSRERLIEAYRMADLFVMPSTGEGFGITFLEAMSCGTPALGLTKAGAVDPLDSEALGVAVAGTDLPKAISASLTGGADVGCPAVTNLGRRFGRQAFVARAAVIFRYFLGHSLPIHI